MTVVAIKLSLSLSLALPGFPPLSLPLLLPLFGENNIIIK
jgi:hypothetical protein